MSTTGPPVPFSSLPLSKDYPDAKLNAWGLYGDKDELGFLNRQTDEIVAAAAASEIKTGVRVSLNAALDFQGMWVTSRRYKRHSDFRAPRLELSLPLRQRFRLPQP